MKQIRKYALLFGAGAFAALQAMNFHLFTFPDGMKVYMGFFFSVVTIIGVFLSGGITLLQTMENTSDIIKKIHAAKNGKDFENNDRKTNNKL